MTSLTSLQGNAPLPGSISISHLRVYNTAAPDGLVGGSPHVHFACSEAYLVIGGTGSVQTLSIEGFKEVPLRAGSLVWFTPGLFHRLINNDGSLELYVIMENAGLPEHGDSSLTFPLEYLQSDSAYQEVASLSSGGAVYASNEPAAWKRRDLAVNGFLELRNRFEREGPAALEAFYQTAVKLIVPKESIWRDIWERGPLSNVKQTELRLDAIRSQASNYLNAGRVFELAANLKDDERKLGFCGTLRPYLPEGVLV
jgi:mannose-6-phosphate isomerase-like protein (cupin superfamily)